MTQYQNDPGIDAGVFGPQWVYEVYIDNTNVYSVANPDARDFDGVTVQMSNGWTAALGEYENFNFVPQLDSGALTPHTINPTISSSLISTRCGQRSAIR